MRCCCKVFLILVTLTWDLGMAEADAVKRELIGHQPGLEFLQLGNFGPVSGLSSHPTFSHLGLTPQQSLGFVSVLLRNGLLNPYAVRHPNGQPLRDFGAHLPFFPFSVAMVDPYFWLLMTHYERFLPFGLGPQGIYGSTGIPRHRPLGLFNGLKNDGSSKLCFVSLVFRHGDRAPEGTYPKDPYPDVSNWPNGWGQLTNLGKLQQYELGKWIRHQYWNFLPVRYNASDIYVRSTDVDRTLVSAYCNLAGLYECWNEEENNGLGLHSIPVHTTPVKMDSVLSGFKHCPAYERLLRDVMEVEEVRLTNEFYQPVYSNLSVLTGLRINSMRDCTFLYSTLNIQNLHGYRLPEWAHDFFPDPLRNIVEFAFKLPCYTKPMKRLKCGPLIKEILRHMQDKQEGKLSQRMWMYSAHDTTVAKVLQCLGVYDGELPPYTATVILEMLQRGGQYYVVVSYKTPTTFRSLKLPNCDSPCPFKDFKKIVSPIIPDDWDKECAK